MTTINLRELYPWYTEDAFIEVSDEVAAFLEEDKRLQINYAQYIRDNGRSTRWTQATASRLRR